MIARLLLKWRIPPFSGPSEHYDSHWQLQYTPIAFAAAIAFSAAVTYAFERPLLRARRALPPA